MANKTLGDPGGNWGTDGTWVEGTKPTAAQDVLSTATSGASTVDLASVCRSVDFTTYTHALTLSANLNIGDASGGALKYGTGMSFVRTAGLISFVSTSNNGGVGWGITCNGILLFAPQFTGVGGKWVSQDTLNCAGGTIGHSAGTIDTNGRIVNAAAISGSNSAVRALTLGTSVVNLTGASITVWNYATTTNLTMSAASATINCTGTSPTFAGGGQSYGTVNFTGTGTAVVTGANTFGTLGRSNAAACALTLPASVTTTVTTVSMNGNPGARVTLASSSGGTAAVLSVPAGTVRFNHCSIKDLTCVGGATFEAYDCLDNTGNTGITFKTPQKLALTGVG